MKKNYEIFASQMSMQAKELIPNDISDEDSKYITNSIYNYTIMSTDNLNNENMKENDVMLISQLVAEWTFRKAIDIIHAKINYQYRDDILKDNAFTVFEIGKQSVLKQFKQNETIDIVEKHVNQKYVKTIHTLYAKGNITKEQKNKALSDANTNKYLDYSKEQKDTSDNFFDDDILYDENLDKKILKATKIENNMRTLAFKYLLRASYILKDKKLGNKRRQFIIKQLAQYTEQIIEYFNFEEDKIKEKDIYKILTLSMQICFNKIIVLSYSGINNTLWENMLIPMMKNIYINSTYYAIRKTPFPFYCADIKIWANKRYTDILKEGMEYGEITKDQFIKAKKKSHINFLNNEILKMTYKIKWKNFFKLFFMSTIIFTAITTLLLLFI